jgi:hypothetical protein
MTTLAQIKRLAAPLLSRNADLALIRWHIVLKPIRHLGAGILIDRTWEANRFRPMWGVTNMFDPKANFPIVWGSWIYRGNREAWLWDDPKHSEAFVEKVERDVLPVMRSFRTLDQFVAFACDKERFRGDPLDAFLLRYAPVQAARGALESARAICAQLATGRTQWSAEWNKPAMARVMDELRPLLETEDRAGIGRLLHTWEAATIAKQGFEALWEPTPFPVELG